MSCLDGLREVLMHQVDFGSIKILKILHLIGI